MAGKKMFQEQTKYEHIVKDDDGRLGTIIVKPSGVGWKPKNGRKFYQVTLDQFERWITSDECGARILTQ